VATAYIDSSCIVALVLREPSARRVTGLLRPFTRLVSSNLLEAEVRAALGRERIAATSEIFAGIDWILPERPLGAELERISALGTLRGADLWHVACALHLDPSARELAFVTLDLPQRKVAAAAGFATPH
jgi:predicted nucleic acid-binding protein